MSPPDAVRDDGISPADRTLAARYGRSPNPARRRITIVVASALALLGLFTGWLWWSGALVGSAALEVRDTGHEILSDRETAVGWQVTLPPGTPSRCAVQALNGSFAIVGWLVVDVPASELRTRDFTQVVRTTELAVTGLIYRCWLT